MEPPSSEVPKLPDMVMCGDHPSFTKTELNIKETKPEDKDQEKSKERKNITYAKITPTSSVPEVDARVLRARRRVRSLEAVQRPEMDITAPTNRALVQAWCVPAAALGSCRWPPYLVAVWVLVLLGAHVLHCLAALLDRALPAVRKLCQYFRKWTEESWKTDKDLNQRVCPIALACLTAILYAAYSFLYVLYAIAIWAIEPLYPDMDEKQYLQDVGVKITNYVDEVCSKTNSNNKH